jgi:hypothetical protein
MNRLRLCSRGRPRVYTTQRVPRLVMLLVILLVTVTSARAQVDITVDPAMTKGAGGAPVTIVEFSDYQ